MKFLIILIILIVSGLIVDATTENPNINRRNSGQQGQLSLPTVENTDDLLDELLSQPTPYVPWSPIPTPTRTWE